MTIIPQNDEESLLPEMPGFQDDPEVRRLRASLGLADERKNSGSDPAVSAHEIGGDKALLKELRRRASLDEAAKKRTRPLGISKFVKDDVVPTVREPASTIADAADG